MNTYKEKRRKKKELIWVKKEKGKNETLIRQGIK